MTCVGWSVLVSLLAAVPVEASGAPVAAQPPVGSAEPSTTEASAVVAAPVAPVEPFAAAGSSEVAGVPAASGSPAPGEGAAAWDLPTCLARALALRSELRDSAASIAVAEADVEVVRAGYLPSASVTAGYTRAAGGFTRSSGLAGVNDFSLGLTARWTATELAWVPTRIESAEASVESVGFYAELTRRLIRFQVIVAYDALWGAKRVAALTRETLAASQTHRAYAVARQEVGLGAQADIARAEVEIADAALAVAAADAAVATARAQLARAIGLPAGTLVDVPDVEPDAGSIPPLPADVPERPEVLALQRQVDSVRAQAEATSAGYWPQVTISASYGVEDSGFFPTQQVWAVGATVDVPLFSWGATTPSVDAAEARAAQVEAQIETAKNDIVLEVQSAWYALQEALARIDASVPLIASAAENLRVAEGLYREGTGSMIELVDARSAVQRAQITRVQAVRDVAIAAAEYRYAVGEEP